MPRPAAIPPTLARQPFRAKAAVDEGLLTRRQLQGACWTRLFPGVYAHAGLTLTYQDRCLAASLFVGDRGVLSGRSAAFVWGADVLPRDATVVEVTVPGEVRLRSRPGLTVVRSALPAEDVSDPRTVAVPVAMAVAVPVTTRARTAFDLARRLDFAEAVTAVGAMLGAASLSIDDIQRVVRARPGWPGIESVSAVLAAAPPKTESPVDGPVGRPVVG